MQVINTRSANAHESSKLGSRCSAANFFTSMVWIVPLVLCLMCICSGANAIDFYAGQTYTFQNSNCYPEKDFWYLWSASAGTFSDYTKCEFVWTAPSVAQKGVVISVDTGTHYLTSCHDTNQITLDVQPLASLGDFVWEDLNANGIQDTDEPGIAGVTVELLDAAGNPVKDASNNPITTQTDVNGEYHFTNLIPGNYKIKFDPPSGYYFSPQDQGTDDAIDSDPDSSGVTETITLASGQTDNTWDAGMYKLATLGDFVWDDKNYNGIQDDGEDSGIGGVIVNLFDATTLAPIATTTTTPDGKYLFDKLLPDVNKYILEFTNLPPGYAFTKKNQGTDKNIDSDADPLTGRTIPITLTSGQVDLTWDAGLHSRCLSGYKLLYEPGLPPNTEAKGLNDWIITVINMSNPSWTTQITTTDTINGNDGYWQVCGLDPGEYKITEELKDGWENVSPMSIMVILSIPDAMSDDINFSNRVQPQDPPSILTVEKTALKSAVHRGEENTYTIKVCANVDLKNVEVRDVFDSKNVQLSKFSPLPSSDGVWYFASLGAGECREITFNATVPVTEMRYDMSQGVSGKGFVNVYTNYDTTFQPYALKNCAYAKAEGVDQVSSCVSVNIIEELGTALKKKEFGTGDYDSEELTQVRTENKSIVTGTSLSASYKPSTFSLPGGRSIGFQTKWTEKSKGKNFVTGASMSEEYTHATKIEKDRTISMDKNGSTMKTEVEFNGTGHIGVLKKESPDAIPKVKPIYESTENYVGAFNITENVDEYGSSVKSEKSTTGTGFAAVDKRVRDSQRTYEYGTGSYNSEEIIDTASNYIAKDINLVHAPAGAYDYSPNFKAAPDIKWKEGMWSRSGSMGGGILLMGNNTIPTQGTTSGCAANATASASLISEEYNSLDYLKKNTVASGLNDMKTEASFSGMADYKAIATGSKKDSELVDEERYVGVYDIKRNVVLGGVARFDHPHLTVTKTGSTKTEWYNHMYATIATYTITVTNDGNRALAPITVRDLLPPGTQYINSSMRPTQMSNDLINWTLTTLGIGNTATITLHLNVTSEAQGKNLINRVQVCAPVDDEYVCATNISALEFNWLACCPPEVRIFKNVRLDATDPTLVHYEIIVENHASDAIAAKVTDELPAGLTLINASNTPATPNSNILVWNILDLATGASKTIDYTARAVRDRGYTNRVHVEAWDTEGKAYDTNDASAYIEITTTGVAPRTTRYGGWQLPADWNMVASTEGLSLEEFAGPSYSEMEY